MPRMGHPLTTEEWEEQAALQELTEHDHPGKKAEKKVSLISQALAVYSLTFLTFLDLVSRKRRIQRPVLPRPLPLPPPPPPLPQSLYKAYQDTEKSLHDAQNLILIAARLAERMHRLWDWTHPWKTRFMLMGMLAGTTACLVIPNNYLVAMALAQKFQSGAAKKWPGLFGKKKKAEKMVTSALNVDGDTAQVHH